jgi:hypothetical protein
MPDVSLQGPVGGESDAFLELGKIYLTGIHLHKLRYRKAIFLVLGFKPGESGFALVEAHKCGI